MLLETLCNVLQHISEALRETMILRQSGEILFDTADQLDVLPTSSMMSRFLDRLRTAVGFH